MINKIYNEDCLKTMARMPDDFIDLTVTSPPYDNLRAYNGYCFDFENVAKELYRVTKKGGVVVWVVGDKTYKGSESGTSFKQALFFKECGFNLHDTMIFNRHGKFPEKTRYWQNFEYMFIFSKGKLNTFNPIKEPKADTTMKRWGNTTNTGTRYSHRNKEGDTEVTKSKNDNHLNKLKTKGNIWYIPTGNNCATKDKCAFEHPAIFPEQLANDHIISWSNEGDIVYDPFAGSGTTCKMSIKNNRKWIASEISDEYCKIIEERNQMAAIADKEGREEKTIKTGKQHEHTSKVQNKPCNIYGVSNSVCDECDGLGYAVSASNTPRRCKKCNSQTDC